MNTNFLVITFSGLSIALTGLALLFLPASLRQFVENNMEYFLTIPPISVASYILVFKYLEKFQNNVPAVSEMILKIFQGSLAAFVFFFLMALITGLLFRFFILYLK